MGDEPIIRGTDAHKVYNSGAVKVHDLRGVNLAIPRGEMVAIMGPSGCGKTTLLNCFSGLDDLTSGDVLIEGVSLASMDDNAKSRYRSRRMGFVFQTYNLLPVLTAVENVELPLLVAKAPAKEARRKALALMAAVELDGWADHKPAQLSAGQQQRVAIARALVNDPAIVWADEPTGNLDSETSAQIMDLLVRLNREQRQTLVLVTLVAAVVGFRPLLARLAARNIGRRKSRVLIVVAGLLVGTAIISSSLVVGDTLSYIFLEDVYARLDAIDELVSNTFNGQLFSFSETNFAQIRADLGTSGTTLDGIAPALLKIMPVRNVAGNKGNQEISVMGLNATFESGFGSLTTADGRAVDTNDLAPTEVYANGRAAVDLNATAGQDLTLFYGTTNQTIVHATLAGIVRDAGKAAYEGRAILFMDLRRAQAAFNETGAINLIRVSNLGGVADGVAYSDRVTQDLRLSIATRHLAMRVQAVKADDIASALQVGRDATDLFLVMGAFGILAGVLLIVNIFVMLAEERKPELGVARALGFLRADLLTTFALEGTFYAVVAAAFGSLAGLGLGSIMVYFFDKLVPHGDVAVTFHFDVSSVVTAFVVGTALTWITILLASWRVSRLNIVRAIRDLPEPGTPERSRDVLIAGLLVFLGGFALTTWGFATDTGMGKIPGPPVLSLGLGIVAASRGWARAAMTVAAAFNLAWILLPFTLLNQATDNVSIAFVLVGVILVGSGILIAVFNVSETLRAVLRRANRGAGRPVLKTAISYPMDRRFRTGMTVAMFALILFMVTLISMLQGLQAASLDSFVRQQSGGYDVIAYTTTYGEIPNFRQRLQENFSESLFAGGWNGTSSASVMPAKVQAVGGNRTYDYTLWGVDNFLIQSNQYDFTSFLPSYINESSGIRESLVTREQVWLSLRYNHTLAIVDRTAAGPNQFVPDESRLRVAPGDRIRAFDAAGRSVNLTIVGVLEQALQFTSGVFVDQSV